MLEKRLIRRKVSETLVSDKGFIQFAWIFALIVGAVILFLAFYFVGTQLLQGRYERSTIEARSLDILLEPFSYFGSLGATTFNTIQLRDNTQIEFSCSTEPDLGDNTITITQKKSGLPKEVYDKYIFSQKLVGVGKSKTLRVMSKPFEMPWRVADLIYLWSAEQEYCFVKTNAPTKIK